MSARTAAQAKTDSKRPRVAITTEDVSTGDDDWYTPKVFRLSPLKVAVTAGKKGKDQIRCELVENSWERQSVHLWFQMEFVKVAGLDHRIGLTDFSGAMTVEHLDRVIEVLSRAREAACKAGLFTPRATPTNIEDVLFAVRQEKPAKLGLLRGQS